LYFSFLRNVGQNPEGTQVDKVYSFLLYFDCILCGFGPWSVILREGQGLKAFEIRVLMRLFIRKRDRMVAGRWKQGNKELHNVYSSPKVIRMIL
jgi:hypothetical protein